MIKQREMRNGNRNARYEEGKVEKIFESKGG